MHSSSSSDPALLAQWLDHRCEEAFRELVGRYAGLVHGTARRTCGDGTMAAEVAQLTFIALASKAKSLTGCPSLAGWLHRTAILQARNQLRQATRENRKRHALQAAMEPPSPSHDDAWQDLQPALDEALAALSANDREALLLRFYRSLSVKEIAATLGIATDAAQKRVDRATDRLRGKLLRRGCPTGGSLSAVMLAGFAGDVQAAGPGVALLASKSLAAGAAGTATTTTVLLTATAMKATALAVPLVVLLAGGIWLSGQWRAIAELESANSRLQRALATNESTATASRNAAPGVTALDRRPVDWVAVARQLRTGVSVGSMTGSFSFLDSNQRLLNRFDRLSRDELIAHWDDLEAAGLPQDDATFVRAYLTRPLTEIDPGYVVKRLFPTFKPGSYEDSGLPALLAKWTMRESGEAVAWLDAQVASGRIPAASKPFEVAVIGSLMPYDLDAAVKRLAALPEDRRNLLWDYGLGAHWGAREMAVWKDRDLAVAYAELARQLPEKEHLSALAGISSEVGEVARNRVIVTIQRSLDGMSGWKVNQELPVSSVRDFIERIQATPAERRACVDAVIKRGWITKEKFQLEYPDALR